MLTFEKKTYCIIKKEFEINEKKILRKYTIFDNIEKWFLAGLQNQNNG